MAIYEITLPGFNGATDKTDNLVLWVKSDYKINTENTQIRITKVNLPLSEKSYNNAIDFFIEKEV